MTWDPYAVLGVSRSASPEEIKRTYRQLVRQCHPDRVGPSGEERFKQITAAYEVLRDPEKRQQWDQQHSPQVRPSWEGQQRVVVKVQGESGRQSRSASVPTASAEQVLQIRSLLVRKQLMAAVQGAEGLYRQFPQDGQVRHVLALAYYRLGEAYAQRGLVDLAHSYLLKAMQTDPQDASLVFDVKRVLTRLRTMS
ncbi:MAG: DnaJ domain-containing protein [Thermostichales cyanobacterium BF4_bins_65]